MAKANGKTGVALAQYVSPPLFPLGKPKAVKGGLYVIEAALNGAEGPNVAIYVTSEAAARGRLFRRSAPVSRL